MDWRVVGATPSSMATADFSSEAGEQEETLSVLFPSIPRVLCFQLRSSTLRTPAIHLSKIARITRPMHAPAIAPGEDAVHDLNSKLSPPVKWSHGIIVPIISTDEELPDIFIDIIAKWVGTGEAILGRREFASEVLEGDKK